jgi:hypothetical protein
MIEANNKQYQLFIVRNLLGEVIHVGAYYLGPRVEYAKNLSVSHLKPPFVMEELNVIKGSDRNKVVYALKKQYQIISIKHGNSTHGYRYKNAGGSSVVRVQATFLEE